MIKVIICGINGKMGKTIANTLLSDEMISIIGATGRPGSDSIGKVIGDIIQSEKKLDVRVVDDLESIISKCDIIVDFTSIEYTLDNVRLAKKYNKAIIIGTTGFDKEQIESLYCASKDIPLLYSSNMSIGVNLLFNLVEKVALTLNDYDIEIIEAHHNQKKDAPSGTAVKIAEIIANTLKIEPEKNFNYGRKGLIGRRPKKEIGILSSRAGDIIGEHTVLFAGTGERIELIHRAHSRNTFSQGTLRAVKWIYGKPSGFYSMKDVLF